MGTPPSVCADCSPRGSDHTLWTLLCTRCSSLNGLCVLQIPACHALQTWRHPKAAKTPRCLLSPARRPCHRNAHVHGGPSHRQHAFWTHSPLQGIIRSFRQAAQLAVARVRELAVDIGGKDVEERKQLLEKCAQTSLNSKLVSMQRHHVHRILDLGPAHDAARRAGRIALRMRIALCVARRRARSDVPSSRLRACPWRPAPPPQVSGERDFFAKMVVDAVTTLDPESLDLRMLGIKKVQVRGAGGWMTELGQGGGGALGEGTAGPGGRGARGGEAWVNVAALAGEAGKQGGVCPADFQSRPPALVHACQARCNYVGRRVAARSVPGAEAG